MLESISKVWPVMTTITFVVGSAFVGVYQLGEVHDEIHELDNYQKRQYGWIKDLQSSDEQQDKDIARSERELNKFSNALDRNTEAVNKLTTVVAVLSDRVIK